MAWTLAAWRLSRSQDNGQPRKMPINHIDKPRQPKLGVAGDRLQHALRILVTGRGQTLQFSDYRSGVERLKLRFSIRFFGPAA